MSVGRKHREQRRWPADAYVGGELDHPTRPELSDEPLTPREAQVLYVIRQLVRQSRGDTILAGMVGSKGACDRLIELGYITRELDSIGPNGGQYWRYRLWT